MNTNSAVDFERTQPIRVEPDERPTLRRHVHEALTSYLDHLDGHAVSNLYELVLDEVEAPLLEVVMRFTRNNQSQAAEVLGMSRSTLRKKLEKHRLL